MGRKTGKEKQRKEIRSGRREGLKEERNEKTGEV